MMLWVQPILREIAMSCRWETENLRSQWCNIRYTPSCRQCVKIGFLRYSLLPVLLRGQIGNKLHPMLAVRAYWTKYDAYQQCKKPKKIIPIGTPCCALSYPSVLFWLVPSLPLQPDAIIVETTSLPLLPAAVILETVHLCSSPPVTTEKCMYT